MSAPRTALLLLNFGGPRTLEEVPRFLFEILRDPNTLQLPFPRALQDLLARRIAARRSGEVARQYGEIGGASPIVAATQRMAEALAAHVRNEGLELPVYTAHRYLPGHTRETAERLVADGVERILALPLYPHFSYATTGSSAEQLREELRRAGFAGEVRLVRSYPDDAGYLDAVEARLRATLAPLKPGAETLVLCSAHGLPVSYVRRGDPYRLELYRSLDALRRRFPGQRFVLSFQSRVGPAEWLQPYTDRILADLAVEGVRNLVFLPLAFVNDHLETLYEIGHTYFGAARALGMTPHLVPAVEAHPAYIGALARMAQEALADRGAVPLDEALPPDQHFARTGFWVWSAWLAAFTAALTAALMR
jgi:ferrochelatase